MQMKFFSIVVVSLNSGERLKQTLKSILDQTFTDYEVIIKDGGSKDGSLDFLIKEGILEKYPQICLIKQPDKSIYDGMNQAVSYVNGKYVQFLNCGDLFYEEEVLQKTADYIMEQEEVTEPSIFYGNQYNLQQSSIVTSAPKINDFTCYRNVPCHQVCFYDKRLFQKRAYLPEYTVRGDYEHFLYCIYKQFVLHCIDYIEKNYTDDLSLEEILEHSGVSRGNFCALFSELTGHTFNSYLNLCRIKKATEYINRGYKITSIYGLCGYNDFSTFFRNFKKVMGISPKEYQKKK